LDRIFKDVIPDFPFAISLASNLFEMSKYQFYFSEHLSKLTDICDGADKEEEDQDACFYAEKLLAK